jgi:parallel beta-helix repeat protein
VNGKPIYYWKGIEGERIPDGATQVILVNCKNVVVENQNLNNASIGIQTAFSSYITIKNNTCSNNDEGIYLGYSTNNSISNNNCSSNNWVGIYLENSNHSSISNNNCLNNWHGIYLADSTNNHIYLNNFINNADNIYSYSSHNIWNSPSRITYTYNETTYTNHLGNYWDDYEGTDADEDGIGDISYSIDTDWYSQLDVDTDWYPLMKPWENYFALPMPGEWRGSAEFGEFVFIVNNSSTGISNISYNFSNWTCGPITRSGGVSISHTPHWPITSGQFTIETDFGGTLPMTIHGKFDETGTHASGTWEAVSSRVTCSGAWDADYNST